MKKVLIADDDAVTLKKLADGLERSGYVTLQARSGKECLDIVRRDDPDLILLDVVMPEMDGLEVLEQLRSSSDVPVVVMSAFGNGDKVEQARKLGIECFLNKPFDTEVLVELLDVILI